MNSNFDKKTMDKTYNVLVLIYKTIFLSTEHLDDEAFGQLTSDDIEEWDSLGKLNLITAIEEEFGLQIPDEEAILFNSFLYIKDYLENV